ncbi:MAG: L,D-transpeptidase [Planctomycetes bacterium]|nr:L,D-transpeptidase [Planctomycetota bacterium]
MIRRTRTFLGIFLAASLVLTCIASANGQRFLRSTESPPTLTDSLSKALALQIALDRSGFSPGVIDGNLGRKTQMALAAFQTSANLPATGRADEPTLHALGVDPRAVLRAYTLTAQDLSQVGPWPKTWIEKSNVKHLGYQSASALVADKGHCSLALLSRLNRRLKINALKAGDTLWIPDVDAVRPLPKAAALQVDLERKLVQAVDQSGKVVAMFHCSIAKSKEKLPKRSCKIAEVALNPVYLFDPKMWPEVKNVHRKLVIPPGPRNPVGLCWIGLSLDGYGIHGTPEPELIGKTGSHGCIRLANWDAVRLAKAVRVGMDVRFTTGPTVAYQSTRDR